MILIDEWCRVWETVDAHSGYALPWSPSSSCPSSADRKVRMFRSAQLCSLCAIKLCHSEHRALMRPLHDLLCVLQA